jgi:hypothetical protein
MRRPGIQTEDVVRTRLVGFQGPESGVTSDVKHPKTLQTAPKKLEHHWPDEVPQVRPLFVVALVGWLDHDVVAQIEPIMPVAKRVDLFL